GHSESWDLCRPRWRMDGCPGRKRELPIANYDQFGCGGPDTLNDRPVAAPSHSPGQSPTASATAGTTAGSSTDSSELVHAPCFFASASGCPRGCWAGSVAFIGHGIRCVTYFCGRCTSEYPRP